LLTAIDITGIPLPSAKLNPIAALPGLAVSREEAVARIRRWVPQVVKAKPAE